VGQTLLFMLIYYVYFTLEQIPAPADKCRWLSCRKIFGYFLLMLAFFPVWKALWIIISFQGPSFQMFSIGAIMSIIPIFYARRISYEDKSRARLNTMLIGGLILGFFPLLTHLVGQEDAIQAQKTKMMNAYMRMQNSDQRLPVQILRVFKDLVFVRTELDRVMWVKWEAISDLSYHAPQR
jgi:Na+/proline symporter